MELETETIHDDMKGKDGDEDVHQAQMLLDHHEDMVGNWQLATDSSETSDGFSPSTDGTYKHLDYSGTWS